MPGTLGFNIMLGLIAFLEAELEDDCHAWTLTGRELQL